MAKRDYYEILGISRNATEQEIKAAYRKLAKKYHPDINKAKDAEIKFKEINEAAEVLQDKDKRARYDRFGHSGVDGNSQFGGGFSGFEEMFGQGGGFEDIFGQSGFDDIFSNIFGGNSRSRTRSQNTSRGEDLILNMKLSFKELIFGTDKKVELNLVKKCKTCNGIGAPNPEDVQICPRCNGQGVVLVTQQMGPMSFQSQQRCPDCNGRGKIFKNRCKDCNGIGYKNQKVEIIIPIPKGLYPGQQVVMNGHGNDSTNGGPSGNLYINIDVEKSNIFRISGNDLIMNYDISYIDAILGKEILINTFDGNVKLKVPKGINSGEYITIKDKGLYKNPESSKRGDLKLKVNIVIPGIVSKETKQKLEEIYNNDPFNVKNKID